MVIMGRLPQTPLVKRVIERAMSEARDLKHNYVGTEHILLGLLSTEEGVAHQVLIRFGLRMDEVCEELRRIKDLAENGISITTYNRNVASIPDEKMREMLELALRLALDIPRGQRITRIEVATEETKKGG
jgi:ATP-dependent Clp protease ATP-binding subunit ClpC